MRLDIRYRTRFRYASAVSASQNELRACPATDHRQAVVHHHVTTAPASRVASYHDYRGTRVDTFGIRALHDRLEVLATATVETQEPVRPRQPIGRAALQDRWFHDANLGFLQPSAHVRWSGEVAATAHRIAAGLEDDVVALAQAVHDHVAIAFEYQQGVTQVGVGVDRVRATGAGVCQDFAHLSLALLRELGVPARYVSGYLFTVDDATGTDTHDDEVEVETHAWIEVAVPGWGWFAPDPTNAQHVGERHVTIGRGRDYGDVAPLRGVFVGDQRHELEVSVSMRRLALAPVGGQAAGRGTQQQQQ